MKEIWLLVEWGQYYHLAARTPQELIQQASKKLHEFPKDDSDVLWHFKGEFTWHSCEGFETVGPMGFMKSRWDLHKIDFVNTGVEFYHE